MAQPPDESWRHEPRRPAREEGGSLGTPASNRLLHALPPDEHRRLLPHLERVEMPIKTILYDSNAPIEHVYFFIGGVASLLMLGDHGAVVEVATIGNEGMIGLPLFLGADATPGRAITQVPGEALRMTTDAFVKQVVTRPEMRLYALLQRYTQALMIQIAQGLACNRLHNVEQRMARWLLMTRDRVGTHTYPLTHEFLAQMLAVRRATVTEVAGRLQDDGLITYARGILTILDLAGLEERACVCYRIIADEFGRMLGAI